MRNFRSTLFLITLLTAVCSITACGGGDDEPGLTPEEERLLALAGTTGTRWTATAISFEGGPASGFDNFSLTLFGDDPDQTLTYTSIDGDPLFLSSGTWSFNGSNINELIVDEMDDNVFTIGNFNADNTPATMTLSVNFTAGGGVAAGVNGTDGLYVLELVAE